MKLSHLKILLIDDFLDVRQMLAGILIKNGFSIGNILEVSNAQKALPYLKKIQRESQHWIVIADFRLPQMSGLDFYKVLQLDNRLRDLPFILIGDSRDEGNFKKLVHQGIHDYFLKPFDSKIIEAKLKNLVAFKLARAA